VGDSVSQCVHPHFPHGACMVDISMDDLLWKKLQLPSKVDLGTASIIGWLAFNFLLCPGGRFSNVINVFTKS